MIIFKEKQISSAIGALILLLLSAMPIVSQAQPIFQINDRNRDGYLSRQEFPGPPKAFDRIDKNRDGYLTPQEVRKHAEVRDGKLFPAKKQHNAPGLIQQQPPSKTRSGPLRFIDTHMHLHPLGLDLAMSAGRESGRIAGPIDEADKLAKAAANLVSRMNQQRLSQALIVVVPSSKSGPEKTYRNLRDAVRKHPDRLRLMAGGAILGKMLAETEPHEVNHRIKKRFRKKAEKLLDEGAVGFGEMLSYHLCMTQKHSFKYTAPNHPLFLLLADIAAEHDVPIDIHMEAVEHAAPVLDNLRMACDKNPVNLTPTIPDLEKLLRHNRRARIVWQHIGWDNTGQMTSSLTRRLLRDHPNLYVSMRVPSKVVNNSGRPIPNRIVAPDMKIKPEWRKLIEDFPHRIMLGSDEFIGPGPEKATLAASFETTWSLVDQLPEKLSTKIGWENAKRVYRLQ